MFHAISLSKSDPTPLYIQLACELAKLIQDGVLVEGFKLPTIRSLSKQLAINRDTVVSAYKLLEQQGLVESFIGKGTYIATQINPTPTLPASYSSKEQAQLCCSHLSLNPQFFPNTLCIKLTNEIITTEGWEAFSDPLLRQRRYLKQSIAHFLQTLGIETHFTQTRFTTSIDDFLLTLFKCSPKTGVCVESLRDLTYSCTLRAMGAKIYEVPLTSEGMDLQVLEKYLRTGTISYIFVTPYLQNPTGMNYSMAYKEKLLELAATYHCYIVEDGTYCDFLYHTSYKPLYNLCKDHRIIYLYHFSKVYLPYMKYTFFTLPSHLMKRFTDDTSCSFNECFLHYYLTSHAFHQLHDQILTTYQSYYEQLLTCIQSLSYLSLAHHEGGLFFWLILPDAYYLDFCNYLTQHQLIIAPGELFSTTPLTGALRLSLSQLSDAKLEQVITILRSYRPPTININ